LRYVVLSTGVAVSAPLLFSLQSCRSDAGTNADYKLTFFDKEEMSLIRGLVDTIMPKTDTPSATSVGVHQMIDRMVGTVYDGDAKAEYRANFGKLKAYLDEKKFSVDDPESGQDVLSALFKNKGAADAQVALNDLRQQTIAYYLSTEEIATNYLNYLPVPGAYEGCITLESVGGKAWAI